MLTLQFVRHLTPNADYLLKQTGHLSAGSAQTIWRSARVTQTEHQTL